MNWLKRKNKILEINIYGWEDRPVSEEDDWKIITSLHKKILYRDPHWHFFYEGILNIIRCSERFHSKVIKELDKQGVAYRENGEWEETKMAIRDNMNFFRDLFHHFSELAMKEHRIGRLRVIYERIGHCFLNHQFYNFKQYRKDLQGLGSHWEFTVMLREAIFRAAYVMEYGLMDKMDIDSATGKVELLAARELYHILGELYRIKHSYEADPLQLELKFKEE